jgi:hypothetical protein
MEAVVVQATLEMYVETTLMGFLKSKWKMALKVFVEQLGHLQLGPLG